MLRETIPGGAKELSIQVTRLGRRGLWRRVLQLLDEAGAARQLLDVALCNAAVTACARSRAWQAGLAIFEGMCQRKPEPDRISINSALNACALGANWWTALQLLKDFPRWRGEANTVSLNTALKACARSEEWEEALQLLSSDLCDVVSFNTVMACCAWPMGLALLAALPRLSLQADLVSYNTLLSSMRDAWERALILAHELLATDGDVVSLGAAFAACEGGQWQAALSLLQSALARRVAPQGALPGLMAAFKAAGRWQEALQIHAELEADAVSSSCALAVLETCGRWREALALGAEMRQRRLESSYAYSALLGACAWAPDAAARGSQLLAQARRDGQVNDLVIEAMLRLLEKIELWEEALLLLVQERQRPSNLVHVATAASACAKGHCWEWCLELLRELDKESTQPDVVLCSTAISACERSYQWHDALALLDAMEAGSLVPDPVAYSATMLACNKADRWDLSLQLLERAAPAAPAAPAAGAAADAAISLLSAALGAQAAARRWPQALQVLGQIQRLAPKAKEKHWLQEAQVTAMFAAQPSAWEQCLALLPGVTEPAGLGLAIRACAMGRKWRVALQLAEDRTLWSAAHVACQAAEKPQPLSPELRRLCLPC